MSSVQSQRSLPGISLSFSDEAGMLSKLGNAIPQKFQKLQIFHSIFSYKTAFLKKKMVIGSFF